jgi:hypothetical protein
VGDGLGGFKEFGGRTRETVQVPDINDVDGGLE